MTTLGPNTTPGTYEFQVQDLLHDPNSNRWTLPQIDGYINEARKQLVMDTGCLRTLQPSYITQGVEQYTFGQVTGASIIAGGSGYSGPSVVFSGGGGSGAAATLTQSGGAVNTISFSNYGAGYTSAPAAAVSDTGGGINASIQAGILSAYTFDVLSINLIWGTERYTLRWLPWRAFSPWYRPYTAQSYQRQPVCWSEYADNTIFIGPTPDQTYAVEFDTVILPTPFVTGDTTTQDAIAAKSQDPIKFYAAYLAKKNAQNYGEAEQHLQDYTRRMKEVVGAYTGRLPDVYGP